MLQFEKICSEIGVLIATVNMLIKIPEKKGQDLLKKIKFISRKISVPDHSFGHLR
jgi:hypothetical protein